MSKKLKLKGLNVESILRNTAHSAHRLGLINTSRLNQELKNIEENEAKLCSLQSQGLMNYKKS